MIQIESRIDGEVVGSIIIAARSDHTYEVEKISVRPEYRRKGIAGDLMRVLIDYADLHWITLKLNIYPTGDMSYDDLAHWYASMNFTEIISNCWIREPKGKDS